jgi:hypothetical protein
MMRSQNCIYRPLSDVVEFNCALIAFIPLSHSFIVGSRQLNYIMWFGSVILPLSPCAFLLCCDSLHVTN